MKKYTLLGATVLVSLAGGNSPEIYANSVAATARADSPADTPQPDDGNRTNTAATPDTGPTQAGAREPGLAEIIVTAQKRAQRINDVGMSITAVPAQELVEKGITDISGLTRVEPSLQYSISNNGTPIFSIRGVGYFEQSLSATPAVSAYQDEVPYLYPIMAKGALLDLDHAEILKGPQGTLYGQNATGGAISLNAAHPTQVASAGINVSYARFNATHFDGFVSGPLTDTLAARFSFSLDEGGAWQKSVTRDDLLGDKDLKVARLILDWMPTETFKVSANLNGFTDDSQTQATQLIGFHFVAPQYISPLTPAQLNDPRSYQFNPAYLPTYPASIQAQLAEPIGARDDQAADWIAGTHPQAEQRYYQGSVRLDYDPSSDLGLSSISSYESFTQADRADLAGNAAPETTGTIFGRADSIYEELRAHGSVAARLNWIVGVNFEHDTTGENVDFDQFVVSSSYLTGGSPYSAVPLEPFYSFGIQSAVSADTKAAFANLDYTLTSRFIAHGGIRYTRADQSFSGCTYSDSYSLSTALLGGVTGACNTLLPSGDRGLYTTHLDESNVPWHVGLDWKPDSNNLVYVSVSKGFKAGTSPNLGAPLYIELTPVTQESLLAYELGAKSTLFDHSLQLNGAIFHYDYKNKQLLGHYDDPLFGVAQKLVNIPESTVDGAEFSATWQPLAGLTLNAGLTYLDSKVTSSFVSYSSYVLNAEDTVDYKGEAFPFTPKWAANAAIRYDWHLNDTLTAFLGADGSYQSSTTSTFGSEHATTEGPSLDNKAYGLLNLTAGVESVDGHWRVQLWGKNVTNTYYWYTTYYETDTVGRLTGMPATYGISVGFRY